MWYMTSNNFKTKGAICFINPCFLWNADSPVSDFLSLYLVSLSVLFSISKIFRLKASFWRLKDPFFGKENQHCFSRTDVSSSSTFHPTGGGCHLHSSPLRPCWGYHNNLGCAWSYLILQIIINSIYNILNDEKASGGTKSKNNQEGEKKKLRNISQKNKTNKKKPQNRNVKMDWRKHHLIDSCLFKSFLTSRI